MLPHLSPQEASHICMQVCRAMCCRGPLLLELDPGEVAGFVAQGRRVGVAVAVNRGKGGAGWVKFADHPGERCPMLDPDTAECRIYVDRPRRCREFPEKLTPGCPISGG